MKLGLCIVVLNEAKRIAGCLAPIIDLYDEVVVVDTGSDDGTPELLRRQFGIEALYVPLDAARCSCLCDPRRAGLERLATPWQMLLDADERIEPEAVRALKAMPDDAGVAGYFGPWINHVAGEPPFEDYKLFVFRQGLRPTGLVHDVVQHDIRARGMRAAWLARLAVRHEPDPDLGAAKARSYRRRLLCAIEREPEFHRHRWFIGYMDFRDGRLDEALVSLERAAGAESPMFPVECLNSAMVLADIHARRRDLAALRETLERASRFHARVAGDFEVRVNFRMRGWIEAALAHCRDERLDAIRAYRFAC